MRLLLVGADSNYAIERPYLNHLSKIDGVEYVELFRAQNQFLQYFNRSVLNKIIYRIGFSKVLRKINKDLINMIEAKQPDAVLIFKGMEIFPSTLIWTRDRGIKLINYNPDNPFLFSGKGSGNINITKSIGLYDLHFTYDRDIKKRIEDEFQIQVHTLPFGFDVSQQLFESSCMKPEIKKVCFVGSADINRVSFLTQLAQRGVQIDLYGNNWKGVFRTSNVQVNGPVYGDEFWETLCRYRIQLNLMRPHNPHSHNMRTFEVPGIGGIQLAPNTYDHSTYFNPGTEIFLFDGVVDCVEQINKLLGLPIEAAQIIRRSAREKSIVAGYSYQKRAEQVYKTINQLLND
jgi:spore maturation protein CgeB